MSKPAIVVIAYNRAEPLQRLLKSLASAQYSSDDITLHISIDYSDNIRVREIAEDFVWSHGNKIVDLKNENLGLLKHVLECGQLTDTYGSIIVLEDDLIVAPGFYEYADQANLFYAEDSKISGISLFTYPVEENNFYPFEPLQDNSDVHFIQVASSWGQCWSKNQWTVFKEWLVNNPGGKPDNLPKYVQEWGGKSWKRLFISYMVDTDRFFVFPNTSFTSNFEEEGTHASNLGLFQVNMQIGLRNYFFQTLTESNCIYDSYFELLPACIKRLNPSLKKYNFEVDIYGEKPMHLFHEYVLTSKRCIKPIFSFGADMKPLIQNVLYEIEGENLVLCDVKELAITEKNRFMMLNASSAKLEKYSVMRSQKQERVTIVIPLIDSSLNDLSKSVANLNSDRFYNVSLIVVSPKQLCESVREIVKNVPLSYEIIGSDQEDLDSLLRIGIVACKSDYCGWMQAGMLIDPQKLEDVASIFRSMRQVQILHGLQNEVEQEGYFKINVSSGRWTPRRANIDPARVAKIRSEFVFWRTSILSKDIVARLNCKTFFLELLMLNPVYLAAIKLGDYGAIPSMDTAAIDDIHRILNLNSYKTKKGIGRFPHALFNYWFRKNVPYFRLFYRELEQMPMVIRYDFKHKSFYLSNY